MATAVYDKIGECQVGLLHEVALHHVCNACVCEFPTPPDALDPLAVSVKFDEFAKLHKLHGADFSLPADGILGRLQALNNTATFLAGLLGETRDGVAENLRWLAGQGSSDQFDDARFWFDENLAAVDPGTGQVRQISGLPCWLFLGEASRDAQALLAAPDRDELPCRLGLPMFLPDKPVVPSFEFVGFVVKAHRIRQARRASVFDGDYVSVKEVWSANGVTAPLAWGADTCTTKGGLPEIVSEPPTYVEIGADIFVFHSLAH